MSIFEELSFVAFNQPLQSPTCLKSFKHTNLHVPYKSCSLINLSKKKKKKAPVNIISIFIEFIDLT